MTILYQNFHSSLVLLTFIFNPNKHKKYLYETKNCSRKLEDEYPFEGRVGTICCC